jgi:hypothetical protein
MTLVERTLPLDLPKPAAQPTGEVMDTQKPYTLPLNNEIALARCIGPYTEIDRKLWATLVALAWDNLAKKSIHEADGRDIARLFRELKGGKNGSTWVMASARRLRMSGLDWENEEEEGTASLLSGLKIIKASGTIYYQFSDFLIQRLLDNKRFSRLRLHFMIGLSGKYSVSLYVILEAAANLRNPIVDMSLDEIHDRLSVPKGKLSRWVDLYRFAIAPAIEQINGNAVAAGFSVECKAVARGRKFERVQFTITKTDIRVSDEKTLKERMTKTVPIATTGKAKPLLYSIDAALKIIRKEARGLDAQAILAEFEAWAGSSEKAILNPLGLLTDFARRKAKEHSRDLF